MVNVATVRVDGWDCLLKLPQDGLKLILPGFCWSWESHPAAGSSHGSHVDKITAFIQQMKDRKIGLRSFGTFWNGESRGEFMVLCQFPQHIRSNNVGLFNCVGGMISRQLMRLLSAGSILASRSYHDACSERGAASTQRGTVALDKKMRHNEAEEVSVNVPWSFEHFCQVPSSPTKIPVVQHLEFEPTLPSIEGRGCSISRQTRQSTAHRMGKLKPMVESVWNFRYAPLNGNFNRDNQW